MTLATPDIRTLEIHPPASSYLTTSCRSSIDLSVQPLRQAIRGAAMLGYNFLSIAGEQSVFYPGLAAICHEAHQMRMLTGLTTRCGLLSNRRLKSLVPSVDLLGIRYEAGMARNLEPVRSSGIPFALVFHLTAANMAELEPTAAFAVAHGAAMLQVRPAEELTDDSMATVWMMIECLRDIYRGELALQLDVLNRYNLTLESSELNGWRDGVEKDQRFLGELISPLVVEEDATVVPLRHGFPRRFALGNARHLDLTQMAADWMRASAASFCEIYCAVIDEARSFADLHSLLACEAGRQHRSFSAAG